MVQKERATILHSLALFDECAKPISGLVYTCLTLLTLGKLIIVNPDINFW